MDDTNETGSDSGGGGEPDQPVGAAAMVFMYLESLRARMAPEQFDAIGEALYEFKKVMESGGEGSFPMDEETFTDDVRKELMVVLAILGTGRMDYQVVEVPCTGEGKGWAVVTDEFAGDLEKLAELEGRMLAWERDHDAVEAELAGIEDASQDQPGA